MNTPTAEHHRLSAFSGLWSGQGEAHASPWSAASAAKSIWNAKFDQSGFNLLVDYTETRDDGSSFGGHGVMTVDPADNCVLWYLFDSFGFPPLAPARGKWSGLVLTLDKQTLRGNGRTIFSFSGVGFEQQVLSKPNGAAEFLPVSTMKLTPHT